MTALIALLAFILILPIVILPFQAGFSDLPIWQHLWETVLPDYLGQTALLLIGTVFWASLTGVGGAWFISHRQFIGKKILRWALLLPLACPAYLLAYAFTDALQFILPVRNLFWASLLLGLTLSPYIYMSCLAGFSLRNVCIEEASLCLGKTPWQTFLSSTLPAMRPFYIAGASLVFMESLNDFGLVDHMAVDTLTTGIYRAWSGLYSLPAATYLGLALLIFVLLVMGLERWGRKQRGFHQSTSRLRELPIQPLKGWEAILLICLITPTLLTFFFPLFYFGVQLIAYDGHLYFDQQYLHVVSNGLMVALMTALICLPVALIFNIVALNKKSLPSTKLIRLSAWGYALPGSLIAIGMLVLADHLGSWGQALVGSLSFLIYAYILRFLAIPFRNIEASFAPIPKSLFWVSQLKSDSWWQQCWQLLIPFAKTALVTSSLVLIIDVLKELPASMILAPLNYQTMATELYSLASDERLVEASPAAMTLLLVGTIPVFIMGSLLKSLRPGVS